MTYLDLVINLHKNSDRQGPGSETDTLKALSFTDFTDGQALSIADIGCGSGGQTITLAKHLKGTITAVDLFPFFLNELTARAQNAGLRANIMTLECSMDELPFSDEQFDLIWSEGAIYNIGFEGGITLWKKFLKPGGYLAISEITWITSSRPREIENFWQQEYPEVDTAANKITILEKNGYSLSGYFFLPSQSWMENYYQPIEGRFPGFLSENKNNPDAIKIVEDYKSEIELYRKYGAYYSYGFYVARRE